MKTCWLFPVCALVLCCIPLTALQAEEAPADSSESVTLLPTDEREWTSSDGKKMKAQLLEVDLAAKVVKIQSPAGKVMDKIPFAKFSEADQKFFATCRVQVRRENKAITGVSDEDPAMNQAMQEARDTFPAAWKKIREDQRRPQPNFTNVMVKARFSDKPALKAEEDAEHMWVGNFTFDGKTIRGTLLSKPGGLKSVKNGDQVSFPLERLSDWTYAEDGLMAGSFTVKLLHSRMSPEEKQEHNEATGINWDKQ